MSETAPQGKCRVCRESFSPFPMGQKNDWRLVGCASCGSVMVDPWPTEAKLEQFFADIQPEIVHVPHPEAVIASYRRTIQKILRDPARARFIDVCARQGYAVEA